MSSIKEVLIDLTFNVICVYLAQRGWEGARERKRERESVCLRTFECVCVYVCVCVCVCVRVCVCVCVRVCE